jgi:hypothetical protein
MTFYVLLGFIDAQSLWTVSLVEATAGCAGGLSSLMQNGVQLIFTDDCLMLGRLQALWKHRPLLIILRSKETRRLRQLFILLCRSHVEINFTRVRQFTYTYVASRLWFGSSLHTRIDGTAQTFMLQLGSTSSAKKLVLVHRRHLVLLRFVLLKVHVKHLGKVVLSSRWICCLEVDHSFFDFYYVLSVYGSAWWELLVFILLKHDHAVSAQFVPWSRRVIIHLILVLVFLALRLERTLMPNNLRLLLHFPLILIFISPLIPDHLHIISMQTLRKHHLILLILHLYLRLVVAKLLKYLPLLLLGQVLTQK